MRWSRRRDASFAPAASNVVPFVAYATDCVVAGVIDMASERLADLLGSQDAYEVGHATVEPLGDGPPIERANVLVVRDELCIVAGTGPRGNPQRRIRTRRHPVHVRVGPYEAWGYVHAVATADPMALARRRQIIPMTDGWIRYPRLGRLVERAHPTLLVNRDLVDTLEEARAQEVDAGLEIRAGGEVAAPG